jgi:hypothetical protein
MVWQPRSRVAALTNQKLYKPIYNRHQFADVAESNARLDAQRNNLIAETFST